MKTTRHSLMAKGILVLLSLLVLIFAITYSWYTDKPKVSASGISAGVEAKGDFEYAIGFSTSQTGGNYKHTDFTNEVINDLNLEELYASDDPNHTQKINLLYDYTPIDITGDGVNLVRPAMNYGNWDINQASDNFSTAEENVQYVSFDLILRTRVAGTVVKLDSGSFAKGACETYSGDGKLLTDTASYNSKISESPVKYKYGNFSRDAIVGAVRVAFLNYSDANDSLTADDIVGHELTAYEPTPALLWIPRPDLFLNNGAVDTSVQERDKDINTEGWSLNTNVTGTVVLNSKALQDSQYSTYQHYYYNIFEPRTIGEDANPKGITVYDAAIPSNLNTSATGHKVTFGQQVDLLSLTYIYDTNNDGLPDDDYYYGKVRVRIWLEGTDSEARRALAGGSFSIGFNITA